MGSSDRKCSSFVDKAPVLSERYGCQSFFEIPCAVKERFYNKLPRGINEPVPFANTSTSDTLGKVP